MSITLEELGNLLDIQDNNEANTQRLNVAFDLLTTNILEDLGVSKLEIYFNVFYNNINNPFVLDLLATHQNMQLNNDEKIALLADCTGSINLLDNAGSETLKDDNLSSDKQEKLIKIADYAKDADFSAHDWQTGVVLSQFVRYGLNYSDLLNNPSFVESARSDTLAIIGAKYNAMMKAFKQTIDANPNAEGMDAIKLAEKLGEIVLDKKGIPELDALDVSFPGEQFKLPDMTAEQYDQAISNLGGEALAAYLAEIGKAPTASGDDETDGFTSETADEEDEEGAGSTSDNTGGAGAGDTEAASEEGEGENSFDSASYIKDLFTEGRFDKFEDGKTLRTPISRNTEIVSTGTMDGVQTSFNGNIGGFFTSIKLILGSAYDKNTVETSQAFVTWAILSLAEQASLFENNLIPNDKPAAPLNIAARDRDQNDYCVTINPNNLEKIMLKDADPEAPAFISSVVEIKKTTECQNKLDTSPTGVEGLANALLEFSTEYCKTFKAQNGDPYFEVNICNIVGDVEPLTVVTE